MRNLSIQLYTVRGSLEADPASALERLASIGFRQVEPFGLVDFADRLAEPLDRLDLSAPTAHVKLAGADLDAVFSAARRLGVGTVIDPMIDPARWTTREGVEAVAAELQEASARAAEQGLRVGYHNHAFELESRIAGTSALEVFAEAVGDAVDLEVDTYWAEVGGESAPELLRRLGERVVAIHVKDGPKTKVNTDQVAVGAGSMPIQEILAAAPRALPVVELDDFSGEIFDAVAASHSHLTSS
ncbi:TIM barrel protein [Nesterenkonia xinjiangensis]|uniref:Sugar phosphate isomerase/epimerase n=1 Tax=Nesterenkonia xinjiangensis TaxID=225327 RepID=A0A7Z0GQ49_9MICC|nr:sugar phosphate isomerase/epimerase [Nesterenkonia xinjiangensis]